MTVATAALDVAYGVGLWALLIVIPATVTLMKGQHLLFVLGLLLVGIVWMVTAFRLARPDSFWARHFYGEGKLRRARARYESEQWTRRVERNG